jgi:hypothetical protein
MAEHKDTCIRSCKTFLEWADQIINGMVPSFNNSNGILVAS